MDAVTAVVKAMRDTNSGSWGRIQAWPMPINGDLGNDVFYGLDEVGYIQRFNDLWFVCNERQEVSAVPVAVAVVTWSDELAAKGTLAGTMDVADAGVDSVAAIFDRESRAERLARVVREGPIGAMLAKTPMHKCPHCKNAYVRKIDAVVCERTCGGGNVEGEACPKCGYQLADHDSSAPQPTAEACVLKTGEAIPWDERAVRLTQAERERVEREAIERSDQQDLTGMLGRLQQLLGQNSGSVWGETLCMMQRESQGLTGKAKLLLRSKLGQAIEKMRVDGVLPTPFGKAPPDWVQRFFDIYEGRL